MAAKGMYVRKKSKDDGCCSINFLKYVLFIFNFVFLMSGVAVLVVGIWTIVEKHQFVNLLSTGTYASIAYLLIVAGILVLLVTVVGCIGVWREDRRALLIYTFMLLLIFLIEAVAGILAHVYEEQIHTELNENLNTTFLRNYKFDADKTHEIDVLQREFKCCGALDSDDWVYSRWLKTNKRTLNKVPDSCCKTEEVGCGINTHPSRIHNFNCLGILEHTVKEHLIVLGAVGLGLCLVQVFGLIVSCSLYLKLKAYEGRYYN